VFKAVEEPLTNNWYVATPLVLFAVIATLEPLAIILLLFKTGEVKLYWNAPTGIKMSGEVCKVPSADRKTTQISVMELLVGTPKYVYKSGDIAKV
jgi:hypothetical protein